MKRITITKLIALSLITATTLQATNGDNLIAVGTKARGMGGTNIVVSHGAESGLGNPHLLLQLKVQRFHLVAHSLLQLSTLNSTVRQVFQYHHKQTTKVMLTLI